MPRTSVLQVFKESFSDELPFGLRERMFQSEEEHVPSL